MTNDPKSVERMVEKLEKLAKKEKKPSRFDVRETLLALGERTLSIEETEGDPSFGSTVERLAKAVGALGPAWEEAVSQEMELACTEHIQGVDPRHLDHPRYDFDYAVAARERLEMRLRALALLGGRVDEQLLTQVERADAILSPYLQARRGGSPRN